MSRSHKVPSRRDLLTLPVKELPPIPHLPTTHHLQQLLSRKLRTKQLLLFHIAPKLPAEVRLDRARMQADRHRVLARARLQVVVERLGDLVDGCLGRAVRVPAAQPVVRDAPYACAHVGPDGVRGEVLEL